MRHIAIACALSLAAVPLAAQRSVVSPEFCTFVEGSGFQQEPLGLKVMQAFRYQEVHDLGAQATGVIDGIAWRRDSRAGNTTKVPPFSIELQMALSTSTQTSRSMSSGFASNEGGDRTVVVSRKKLDITPFPHLPIEPQLFLFSLPFDPGKRLPFSGGSLCIDVEVYASDMTGTLWFDGVAATTLSKRDYGGNGCVGSRVNSPFTGLAFATLDKNNQVMTYSAYSQNGIPNGFGINVVSLARLDPGLPLPGGCTLYVDPQYFLFAVPGAGSSTSLTYRYPPLVGGQFQGFLIPWDVRLSGLKFTSQCIGVDPRANAMGLVFSGWSDVEFPTWSPTGLGVSSVAAASGATHGNTVNRDRGLVTRVSFQ